ncbi:acyltransferase [Paenibacillus sp. GCM10027627]|uniref:acyltransferase n=1 Tax=unclassified Paenibacillus TaxID=185978 RepID=UPI003632BB84
MGALRQVVRTFRRQYEDRGFVSMLALNKQQFFGLLRACLVKILYAGRLKGGIFFMQAGSSIELLSRGARLSVGKFVFIRKNTSVRIDHRGELLLGDHVFINDNCTINCVGRMSIGAYTKIAPNVCINDHDHNFRDARAGHLIVSDVTIGRHVWIGANAVILRGTVIGDYAVVAAGSVVKGEVPAHTLYVNKRESRMIPIGQREPFPATASI